MALALAGHILLRRAATRYAARFPAVGTLREAARASGRWRAHVPSALVLAGLLLLGFALAGPRVTVRIPVGKAQIVLVTDHSGSMQATDVRPSRMIAANRAARTFVHHLPHRVRVGVVTFSDQPDAVLAPTTNRTRVMGIIDAQQAVGATATGDALQVALGLLRRRHGQRRLPAAIVLLSDGAANAGLSPTSVAGEAAHEHVPIYTVSLGSRRATIPDPENPLLQVPVPPDPALLARIAQISHGQAFSAADQSHLQSIYGQLAARLGTKPHHRSIRIEFLAAALALLVLAFGLSMRWSASLP